MDLLDRRTIFYLLTGLILQLVTANNSICNTEESREKRMTSPNFPANYTPSRSCTKRIIAPPNYRIKISFREEFFIEGQNTSCKFDHLEIRDGAFAFSPILVILCGNTFPRDVVTTGTGLWARFVTDNVVEKHGFRFDYEFFESRSNITDCRYSFTEEDVNLLTWSRLKLPPARGPMLSCGFEIKARPGFFIKVSYTAKMFTENDCKIQSLDIYDGNTLPSSRVGTSLCKSGQSEYLSKTDYVVLHLKLFEQIRKDIEFQLSMFWIRRGPCGGSNLTERSFDCGDGWCLPMQLECNHMRQCENGYDENPKQCSYKHFRKDADTSLHDHTGIGAMMHVVIVSSIGSFLVLVVFVSISLSALRCRKKRLREEFLKRITCTADRPQQIRNSYTDSEIRPPKRSALKQGTLYELPRRPYSTSASLHSIPVWSTQSSNLSLNEVLDAHNQVIEYDDIDPWYAQDAIDRELSVTPGIKMEKLKVSHI